MSKKSHPQEEETKQQTPAGEETTVPQEPAGSDKKKDTGSRRVIWFTRVVLLVAALFFVWYIFSDRLTPYTDQGRITEITIPVTPRVSGYLTGVYVSLHSQVRPGDLLFCIDTTQYALAVRKAKANLENVLQQLGAQSASVTAAASSVGVAKAQLDRARRNYNRVQRIIKKNPGALSQAEIDRTETSLNQAVESLAHAEANLSQAKKQLGPTGRNNPQLRMAISDLNNAQMQLDWTNIYAYTAGHIESFNLDIGYYCQAGKPIATLVSEEDLWIQTNFKENNLSHIRPGNRAKFILDVAPGKIFEGKVRSISYGVASGNKIVPGDLPQVSSTTSWLLDPQRFPVIITITDTTALSFCRAGGQADVVVFTGDHPFLNRIAGLRIWINTWLSYVR
jgi:multidrug resistance efflux pump